MESLLESSTKSQEDTTVIDDQLESDGHREDSLRQPEPYHEARCILHSGGQIGESSKRIQPGQPVSRRTTVDQNAERKRSPDFITPTIDQHRLQGDGSMQLPLKIAEKFPVMHLTANHVKARRDTILDGPSGRPLFIPMFPKNEVLPLVEVFLDEVNITFPLFHKQTLLAMCQDRLPVDGNSQDAAWWACLNTIIAISIRLKSTNNAFRRVSDFSWSFFKNAFAVYQEITANEPSILSVQAILAMAIFTTTSTDTRTTALLASTAIGMIQIIGLHREDNKLSIIQAEQCRRVFWIAYCLDKTTSINSGLPSTLDNENFEVSLPSEASPDGLGNLNVSKETGQVNIFRLRIQLVIIGSKAEKCLSSASSKTNLDHDHHSQALELEYELEVWKENVPLEIRPGHNVKTATLTDNFTVLMLHFEFHY